MSLEVYIKFSILSREKDENETLKNETLEGCSLNRFG
jgi:hypothetical protein